MFTPVAFTTPRRSNVPASIVRFPVVTLQVAASADVIVSAPTVVLHVEAAAAVIVSAPTLVVNDEAALAVNETAPVNCVRPPVTVVVMPERPMATAVEVAVPRFSAAVEVIVRAPTVVVRDDAALPVNEKAPVNCVRPPVTVVVIPECPMATELALEAPSDSTPAPPASMVRFPAVVLQVADVAEVNVKAPTEVMNDPPLAAMVVVAPALPKFTERADVVPRNKAPVALESIVKAPALVVNEDAAFPVSDTAPVNCVKPPVTVVVMPK